MHLSPGPRRRIHRRLYTAGHRESQRAPCEPQAVNTANLASARQSTPDPNRGARRRLTSRLGLRWILDGPTNTVRLRGDGNDEEGASSEHRRQRYPGPGGAHRRTISSRRLRGELRPLADDPRPNPKRCNGTCPCWSVWRLLKKAGAKVSPSSSI